MYRLKNDSRKQQEYQKLLKAEHATTIAQEKNRLQLLEDQRNKQLQDREAELKLEDEMINPRSLTQDLQSMHLDMYRKMTLNETKIINMGKDQEGGEPATDLMRQMFVTYKALGQQM